MNWWFQKREQLKKRELTVQEARRARELELLSRLRTIDAEGRELSQSYATWRYQHLTADGALLVADYRDFEMMHAQRMGFLRRGDAIDSERNSILQELARIEAQREYEELEATANGR